MQKSDPLFPDPLFGVRGKMPVDVQEFICQIAKSVWYLGRRVGLYADVAKVGNSGARRMNPSMILSPFLHTRNNPVSIPWRYICGHPDRVFDIFEFNTSALVIASRVHLLSWHQNHLKT